MRVRQAVAVMACVVAVLVVPGLVRAQAEGEARIAGKVVDQQKKPVPDAIVRAQLAGQMRQAKTNNRGEWSINNIAGGMWEIEFTKEGFAPQRITLDLKPDQRIANVDVMLAPPAPAPISITATATVMQTTGSST